MINSGYACHVYTIGFYTKILKVILAIDFKIVPDINIKYLTNQNLN